MAKKVYCDGCDQDISHMVDRKTSVPVKIEQDGAALLQTTFDLCDECRRHLVHTANPKRWARCDNPKAA